VIFFPLEYSGTAWIDMSLLSSHEDFHPDCNLNLRSKVDLREQKVFFKVIAVNMSMPWKPRGEMPCLDRETKSDILTISFAGKSS